MPRRKLIYLGRSRLHRNRANLIQTLHTVDALAAAGIDVTLFLPPIKGRDLRQRLVEFDVDSELDLRPTRFLHSSFFPAGLRLFSRLRRGLLRRADMVYCRSLDVSLALVREGVPHSLEVHDALALIEDPAFSPLLGHYNSGAIRYLFPISGSAGRLLQEAGADPARIEVCHSGADLKAFAAAAPFDKRNLSRPNVIYLGRIDKKRGQEIFERVAQTGKAHVYLVGVQGNPVSAGPNLTVEPFVPHAEVPGWYGRGDVVLLPYQPSLHQADSFSPVKIFEAMAAGRPIIASDLPPIREIIEDGETGLLVPPQEPEAWLEALDRLRRDPELGERLAGAARAKAPLYTWEARAKKIMQRFGWEV